MPINNNPKTMGVKHFYSWYKNHFSSCNKDKCEAVDVLAIDLNGIFHTCAQRIYKYGNSYSYLLYHSKTQLLPKTNLSLFRDICEKIEYLRNAIQPRKTLVLSVDGVAGMCKIMQQRQRRFKTSVTVKNINFDPNAFTPGTKLMDHLTKYIDWYIRTMLTLNPEWQQLEIIFSNEKVPGEGEHKIMSYLKKKTFPKENICVYGMDADLMMLGILLPSENIYIARESEIGCFEYIHLHRFRNNLLKMMAWEPDLVDQDQPLFDKKCAINDFILLCFFLGNDFLPTIPTIYASDGAIDVILEVYKDSCRQYGHLTREDPATGQIGFENAAFIPFLTTLGKKEQLLLEKKYNSQQSFFPDPFMLRHTRLQGDRHVIDFDRYKQSYYGAKFKDKDPKTVVKEYLDGMFWIMNYYKKGMPDWTWFYPFMYAPFLSDFAPVLQHYSVPEFVRSDPIPPFLQLLMVLPESSKDLLPEPFHSLVVPGSPLQKYFPDSFEIDLTGKRKEWEGIVLLPIVDYNEFLQEYQRNKKNLSYFDQKRNISGKIFSYQFDPSKTNMFSSFYGNIQECPVRVVFFHV